ncbi:hypothetical protein F5141DRAFT_1066635 [Pisolithus sp. B1]|nr:hypothetical protein F5141DRAFT_1066635 [Pisolithus sp. B1]
MLANLQTHPLASVSIRDHWSRTKLDTDKDQAHWTDKEKEALILFLVEQKISGKMGDGSFKTAIWNTTATHLSERFLNQKGPMKTAEMCKGKVTSHWDNSNGVNIAMEDEEKDFQDWMGSRPGNSMCLFKNSVGGPSWKEWRYYF